MVRQKNHWFRLQFWSRTNCHTPSHLMSPLEQNLVLFAHCHLESHQLELDEVAPTRPKRKAVPAVAALKTPPDAKRLKKLQKDDVNRCIAPELVCQMQDGQKQVKKGAFSQPLEKHKAMHGSGLVDQTAACKFRKDTLEARAASWLPQEANLPSRC